MGQSSSKDRRKTRKEKQTLRVPVYNGSFGRGYKFKTEYGVLNLPADNQGVRNKFHSAPRLRRISNESPTKGVIVYSSSDTGQPLATVQHPTNRRPPVQNIFDRRQNGENVIVYTPTSNGHPVGRVQHRSATSTNAHEVFEGTSHHEVERPTHPHPIYLPEPVEKSAITTHRIYSQMTVAEMNRRKADYHGQKKNASNGRAGTQKRDAPQKRAQNIHRTVPKGATSSSIPNRPPIVPPWGTKRDLIPDPRQLLSINTHAVKCPPSACTSLRSLATYLTQTSKNDLQRVRAIYWWIICNIRYDINAVLANTHKVMACDPLTVLNTRKAVCYGFTNLFAALCREVDLLVKIVSGFSKDFFYNPNDPFYYYEDCNHSWNLVYVHGEWRPVDCTWASGYINDMNQFCLGPNDFYFLTDPEKFVWSHFPFLKEGLQISLQYQLLSHPISLEDFNRKVSLSQPGYHWGLELLSHKENIIQVDGQVRIEFRLHKVKLLNLVCDMKSTRAGENCDRYVLARRKRDGSFSVTVYPPEIGNYRLKVYGEPPGENRFLMCSLLSYSLHCNSCIPRMQPYPKISGLWGVKVDAEKYGFAKDVYNDDFFISDSGLVEFSIGMVKNVTTLMKLHHAVYDIPDLNDFVITEYTYSGMNVKVRLPRAGYYKLSLLGKPQGVDGNTVDLIADYLIHCKEPLPDCQPFPKTFPFTQTCMSVLEEPNSGWIPANQSVNYTIKCPNLKRVLVDGKGSPPVSPGVFKGEIQARPSGGIVSIYGNLTGGVDHDELYRFIVVDLTEGVIV